MSKETRGRPVNRRDAKYLKYKEYYEKNKERIKEKRRKYVEENYWEYGHTYLPPHTPDEHTMNLKLNGPKMTGSLIALGELWHQTHKRKPPKVQIKL